MDDVNPLVLAHIALAGKAVSVADVVNGVLWPTAAPPAKRAVTVRDALDRFCREKLATREVVRRTLPHSTRTLRVALYTYTACEGDHYTVAEITPEAIVVKRVTGVAFSPDRVLIFYTTSEGRQWAEADRFSPTPEGALTAALAVAQADRQRHVAALAALDVSEARLKAATTHGRAAVALRP